MLAFGPFNTANLYALAYLGITIGVVLLGFGILIRGLSPVTGSTISRFGGQLIALGVLTIFAAPVAHELLGEVFASWVIIGLVVVFGLVIFQSMLNLIFGPNVGARVTSEILVEIFRAAWTVIATPIAAIARMLRR